MGLSERYGNGAGHHEPSASDAVKDGQFRLVSHLVVQSHVVRGPPAVRLMIERVTEGIPPSLANNTSIQMFPQVYLGSVHESSATVTTKVPAAFSHHV